MPDEAQSPAQFRVPAEHYDRFMGRYTPVLAAALADAVGIRPGMRVLDVGCGPGGLTRELAGRLGPGNVAAIDPAPQFAAACHDRNPGADVRVGVAEQLPWPTAHFDAALSCLVIGFLHDPGRAVLEMARIVRPGGTVAACMWDIASGGMTMLQIFWTAARQVQPGAPGETAMAGTSDGDIASRLRHAGLQDVTSGALASHADTPTSTTSGSPSPSPSAQPATTCAGFQPTSRQQSATPAARTSLTAPSLSPPALGTPAASSPRHPAPTGAPATATPTRHDHGPPPPCLPPWPNDNHSFLAERQPPDPIRASIPAGPEIHGDSPRQNDQLRMLL